MGVLIFFIIIFIIIVKISSKFSVNILDILNLNDFQKIIKIRTTATKTFYTAIKNGENFLIANIDSIKNPDAKDIDDTAKVMEEIHYHYGILITKATCSKTINDYAKRKEIKVVYFMDLLNSRNENIINDNNVIETKIDNNIVNDIENYQESPIKEVKGNSIISNLFKKPDRL